MYELKASRLVQYNILLTSLVFSTSVALAPHACADDISVYAGDRGLSCGTSSGADYQRGAWQFPIYLADNRTKAEDDKKSEAPVRSEEGGGVTSGTLTHSPLNEEKAEPKYEATGQAENAAEATTEETALAAEVLMKQRAEEAAWSHFDLAHYYVSNLNFELADTEFEESIISLPNLKVAHRDYCLVCIARLNFPKAVAEFMMATDLGEAVPYTPFEKAEIDARAAKLHYRQALKYGKANRWPHAIVELQWALSYAPSNPALKRSLAFAYASAGQFEAAERQYSDSFAADPSDAYSHADFAFLLSDEGKQDKAINQISKAVELEPRVAALHIDLAWFSEKNGELARATNELKEAVKLSPKHAILWAHLGRLLEQQGDDSGARKAYAEALALDPQLAEAKEGLSKSNKASN